MAKTGALNRSPAHLLHSCAWDPHPRGTILIATRSPVSLCSASSTVPFAPLHQRTFIV